MREEIISFLGDGGESKPFYLKMAGVSYCDGNYRISRKNSPTFVFEYVMEGKGTLIVDSAKFEPEKGDVYIIHKETNHTYFSSKDDPWVKIWFNLRGVLVAKLIEAYGLNNVFLVKNCPLLKIFEKGYNLAKKRPEGIHESISLIILQIIQKISSELEKRGNTFHSPEGLKLKNHIETNCSENIDISALGRLIGRSPSQTIRIFKKEWGKTPYGYLLERRIESAKSMLLSTALTVKEISSSLGFKDQYYFSNIFKKKAKISPANYRKENRSL